MEPRELQRHLQRRELAQVICLWGEESWLVEEAGSRIESIALDPETRDFNRQVFYGDEADVQAIVSAAQTFPWLGSQRLVVLRGADALPRAADAVLIAYCAQPSPSTCLLVIASRVEASRPLFAHLLKLPWAVRFRRLLPRELATWIEQRAAANGCRITAAAVAALIECVGNDLHLLAKEIDKLVTFVGGGQTIEVENVSALTSDIREMSAFELARCLSAGDVAGALRAWSKFAASGEYPGLALGAIIHHVRQLWRIKLAQSVGASPERLARELNMPAFAIRRLSAEAAGLDVARLRHWLEVLLEADQSFKRSGLPVQVLFDRLILHLCVRSGGTHRPA
jgi:DNA polymerase-3 subunit delta